MTIYQNVPTNAAVPSKFKGYAKRHTQSILMFICLVWTTCVRSCINVAILAMTNSTIHGNETQTFEWDKPTQGLVMSAFHWGDLVMQIPSGYLVCKYGGKPFLTLSTAAIGLTTFITPVATRYGGWQGACASRVLVGLFSAFLFPCIHTLLGKWAPLSERNRLGIIIYAGWHIALIIASPISGYISTSPLAWPWIFYFFGIVCLLSAVLYYWIGSNSPAEHRSITKQEKVFIESSLGEEKYDGNKRVPWKSIITSKPVIALIGSQCLIYSSYTIMMCEIPTFFMYGLNIDLESSGVLSSLPYIASFIASIFCSFSADYLLVKNIFSLTVIRKLYNSVGCFIPAASFVGLLFISGEQKVLAITLVIFIIAGDALTAAGIMLNHIDLSPNFAGVIVSWSMTISDIGNLLAPIISGNIVKDPSDMSLWRTLFIFAATIYSTGNVIFVLFGNAEKQSWNDFNDPPNIVLEPSELIQELKLLNKSYSVNERTTEKVD